LQSGAAYRKQGSFGQVHEVLGSNSKSTQLAVKVIPLHRNTSSSHSAEALHEAYTLRRLAHPNIVKFVSSELRGSELCILQEMVHGCSITALLRQQGPFEEERAQHYAHQLLQAVLYLHTYCIVHRDIKGDNVLVDQHGIVKLIDFGSSARVLDAAGLAAGIAGTALFCAPEVLQRQQHGLAVDIWSFGCTILQVNMYAWALSCSVLYAQPKVCSAPACICCGA
jgi:mitogen-activated protein kinase kinase kinase